MKTALSILTVLVAATTAFCRPVGVEIQPADLKILSDLPAMSFRITAEDRTSSANKPAPMKGLLAVEGVNAKPGLAFQIGDETIGLNVEHQVAGPTVTVNTKWETTSNPPARWMETLIVPSDIAQDLTADIDGFPAFHNYEVMPPPSPLQKTTDLSKITFRRSSTNAILFEITGTIPQASLFFDANRPDMPLQVRILPKTWLSGGNLLDMPESALHITFP